MSSTADPSLDRLQTYIRNYFPDLRSVDRGQAIFWFATHYNKGPGSNLFAAVQSFAFSGVPLLPAPERGDPAWEPYQMLSVTYEPFRRPQDPNKASKAERQHKPKAKRVYKRKAKPGLPAPTLLGVDWFMIHFTKGWVSAMDEEHSQC